MKRDLKFTDYFFFLRTARVEYIHKLTLAGSRPSLDVLIRAFANTHSDFHCIPENRNIFTFSRYSKNTTHTHTLILYTLLLSDEKTTRFLFSLHENKIAQRTRLAMNQSFLLPLNSAPLCHSKQIDWPGSC